jgi:hypothetical protein
LVASNQPDAIGYQTLEQLEEETSTDPIVVQPIRNQSQESNPTSPASPAHQTYSNLTFDSVPVTTAPSPGMYRSSSRHEFTIFKYEYTNFFLPIIM